MAIMMNSYHLSLIFKNLTTNEHMNMRYPYLRDEMGRFHNGEPATAKRRLLVMGV